MATVHPVRFLECAGGHFVTIFSGILHRGEVRTVVIDGKMLTVFPDWVAEVVKNTWKQMPLYPLRINRKFWEFEDMGDHIASMGGEDENMIRLYPSPWTKSGTHFTDVGWRKELKKVFELT